MLSEAQAKVVTQIARSIVPSLKQAKLYKGQLGKIGVIGGAFEYTGAPFIAAISAMRTGCDLSYVICSKEAGTPIKSYGPEIIVLPLLRTTDELALERGTEPSLLRTKYIQSICDWVSRMSAVVIGPGLGRDGQVHGMTKLVVDWAKQKSIPLDGLWAVENDPLLVRNYNLAVLTPNVNEYNRLCQSILKKDPDLTNPSETVVELARTFPVSPHSNCNFSLGNVTIVRKGDIDIISDGNHVLQCDVEGSLRRVGGQGDVLAGTIGTFVGWSQLPFTKEKLQKRSGPSSYTFLPVGEKENPLMLAAYGGCALTRLSARRAFKEKGRSMLAYDLVDFIGPNFADHFEAESYSSSTYSSSISK